MANEPWDWGKALNGLIDPVRFLKSCFMALQILIAVIVCYAIFVGGVALWNRWAKPKVKPQQTVYIDTVSGGTVLNGDKNTKWGVITF